MVIKLFLGIINDDPRIILEHIKFFEDARFMDKIILPRGKYCDRYMIRIDQVPRLCECFPDHKFPEYDNLLLVNRKGDPVQGLSADAKMFIENSIDFTYPATGVGGKYRVDLVAQEAVISYCGKSSYALISHLAQLILNDEGSRDIKIPKEFLFDMHKKGYFDDYMSDYEFFNHMMRYYGI